MKYTVVALVSACLVAGGCSARAGVSVQPEVAVVVGEQQAEGGDRVWVCHQGRWQEVAAPAAQGHSRHGDAVSSTPRTARGSC